MDKKSTILAALCTFAICITLSACASAGYWPKEAPDTHTVESAIWEFDSGDIEDLCIISVSPSGKYILAADQIKMNYSKPDTAGIYNPLCLLPDCLYVFTYRNGVYKKTSSIEVDADFNLELSSTLGMCREEGVAWNKAETQAIITVGINYKHGFGGSRSNIYLVDFSKQTFNKLTANDDDWNHSLLPQWVDNENIRFIHYEMDSDKMLSAGLVGMNLKTGKEELLSDLSADGRMVFIFDYRINGGSAYFSRECLDLEYSGFYKAKLDGGKTPPISLLNMSDIRDDNIHPYALAFSSVQISHDGHWACLTAQDQRFYYNDIPTVDDPYYPQADPSSAKSPLTGKGWIPCHDVFVYDLKNNELIDPFTDKALHPDVVIATAATFAPDGKSLLCAVFGDSDEWTQECYSKTTLYQIRLEDGEALRIFETDVPITPNKLSWLENNSLLIRTWEGLPPSYPVQIIIPAAFKRLLS